MNQRNEYNKVEIELRVVQFWTEIKLVITNSTPASRSCDFVITRLISVQIALHSVQLPLFIVMQHATTRNLNWFSNNQIFYILKLHLHWELSLKTSP
jgi:hypothetical protein